MTSCHSAIDRPYFFSIEGKYEAGPFVGQGGDCSVGMDVPFGASLRAVILPRIRNDRPVVTLGNVTSWGEFEDQQPAMAAVVRRCFDARRHKTIATIRADGSPRISGIECSFDDGRMTFGSMPKSRKLDDLHRDPRFALHSPTEDPIEGAESSWRGEAKVSGYAIPHGAIDGDGAPEGELFVADVTEVVFVHLDATATRLIVDWWTPDGGPRRVERA